MDQTPDQYDSPWKEALEVYLRSILEFCFNKKHVLESYRLVDWLLRLPADLEQDFKRQVREYEESKIMPYVTSIERLAKEEGWTEGLEKGRQEGREEGWAEIVLRLLRRRWEPLPAGLEDRVRLLTLEQRADLAEALFDLKSLADVEAWLSAHGSPGS